MAAKQDPFGTADLQDLNTIAITKWGKRGVSTKFAASASVQVLRDDGKEIEISFEKDTARGIRRLLLMPNRFDHPDVEACGQLYNGYIEVTPGHPRYGLTYEDAESLTTIVRGEIVFTWIDTADPTRTLIGYDTAWLSDLAMMRGKGGARGVSGAHYALYMLMVLYYHAGLACSSRSDDQTA
jgi:hypothetical protein